ncbi:MULTISPECIES: hypothetical protein [Rhizobium]|jgi:hypothetical protein|uniref:Uncharacterized protein n=1 Tax=Rhizobium lusitanum TaxID=293958 RepID=A0A1C3VX04_9HYPH|nr:hypothetical protein [Rhizobium lusitanum]NTJ10840.1 hypothetical protein [Rhizobium lusitanum]SCB32155.1 hypothetical protein GA0061101_10724 [Rhizobium lusitanum]
MQARDIGTPRILPARRAGIVEHPTAIVMAGDKTGSPGINPSRREVLWGVLEIGDIDLGFDDGLSFEISQRSLRDANRNRPASTVGTNDTNNYADRSYRAVDQSGRQLLPNRRNSNS